MNTLSKVIIVFTLVTVSMNTSAATYTWTDWTNRTVGDLSGKPDIEGALRFNDGSHVDVTYSGSTHFVEFGTSVSGKGGRDHFRHTESFISSTVDNPPPSFELIAAVGGIDSGFTFSEPVVNPVFAVVDLGQHVAPSRYIPIANEN
ncbi:MAG: hypothetical protein V4629_06770 [Pseudomonadota bacterium]